MDARSLHVQRDSFHVFELFLACTALFIRWNKLTNPVEFA